MVKCLDVREEIGEIVTDNCFISVAGFAARDSYMQALAACQADAVNHTAEQDVDDIYVTCFENLLFL